MMASFLLEDFRFTTRGIFEGLSPQHLQMLSDASVTHHYKKGEIVFREGGIPAGIFYLVSGKVKKFKTTSGGSEQIFYLCTAGELLGYHAVLSEEYYPDSAATIEDAEITFIPKENFLKVLHESSLMSNRLLKALGHEFSVFINVITSLATKPVRERVALNLLILDERFRGSEPGDGTADIEMSRGDLANMVGTAKENLVRVLQQFRSGGLIDARGRSLRILDRKALMQEARLSAGRPGVL